MLLSIIIPTHNREKYAKSSILAALSLGSDVEVVVTDSSTNDNLRQWVSDSIVNSRLKYVRTDSSFTVVDNFNCGLKNSSGDYLCFLGDDDFVDKSILDVAAWARNSEIDVIQCTLPASFYWPDFRSRIFGDGYSARLAIKKFTGTCSKVDSIEALNAALKNLGGGVMHMPRAYLGLLSRRVVKDITDRWGNLFGGVSPDIYSAALISHAAKKAVLVDYPFIVPGSSGVSTSGLSAMGKHNGALRDNPHIAPFKNLVWNNLVPEYYSVPTVWSYSLIEACRHVRLNAKPNYGRLYLKCLIENPSYYRFVLSSIKIHIQSFGFFQTIFALFLGGMAEFLFQLARVARRVSNPKATADSFVIEGVTDCCSGFKHIREFLVSSQPLLLTQ